MMQFVLATFMITFYKWCVIAEMFIDLQESTVEYEDEGWGGTLLTITFMG